MGDNSLTGGSRIVDGSVSVIREEMESTIGTGGNAAATTDRLPEGAGKLQLLGDRKLSNR